MKSTVAALGALTTLSGQLVKYLIQVGALVLLARLLTPNDYSLIAMVGAIVGVAMVIGDFGLGLSAIQAKDLTTDQRENLFWINAIIGILAGLIVSLSGPALARFYRQPELTTIPAALSLTFVPNGLSFQFRAELTSGLRFISLTYVDLIAQGTSFGLAIIIAIISCGYWSLVAPPISFAAVALMGLVLASKWIPGWPKSKARKKSLYAFGASTFVTQLINYISSNADSVALGCFLGSSELGLYNRAFQILSLPLSNKRLRR